MLENPITDITIAMELNYFQLNRAEYFVPVAVKIPGSELALARRRGAQRTLLDFIGEIKDEYGITMQNVRDKLDIPLTTQTAAQLATRPIQYETGFTLLPGKYVIKFLARDAEAGRIGTYQTSFTIPNLNREEKRLPISSVVLGSQRVPLGDALHSVQGRRASGEPARLGGSEADSERDARLQRRAATCTCTCRPTSAAPRPRSRWWRSSRFYRGDVKAFETQPLPVVDGMDERSKAVPVRLQHSACYRGSRALRLPGDRAWSRADRKWRSGARQSWWSRSARFMVSPMARIIHMRSMSFARCVATLTATLGLAPPAWAQAPDAAKVMADARAALGGEARLAAVKTVIATGRTRQVQGNNLVPIEFEIQIELPDKYARRDEIPARESGPTTLGFNGDALIQVPPAPAPPPRAGAPPPTPEQLAAASRARVTGIKQDVARVALGMFASSFGSYPLTFTYAAQAEAPQGKADVIDVAGPGGFAARLFVNSQTHLPVMVTWEVRGPAGGARGAGPGAPPPAAATPGASPQTAAAPAVEHRLYFADYREVEGLQLPFRLRHAVGSETTEETTFDRYRINARVDARRFVVGN